MVLKIGILFKMLLKISKNFFPKKDKDKPPIIVVRIIVINISIPYTQEKIVLTMGVNNLVEIFITNKVIYIVIPTGIKTIAPATK